MHYYKMNIADWNLSTAHLSLEEEAIYFRLINHYYDTESPIPIETHSVFRRLRLGSSDEKALAILGEFFELTDKGWLHKRCEKNLKEYKKTKKKNKVNGANGGRPRKDAASKETQKKPSGFSEETQTKGNHKPLTTNHKPLTTNQRGDAAIAAKATPKKGTRLPDDWAISDDYWNAASKTRPDLIPFIETIAESFKDHWHSKSGRDAVKLDWLATWRNWLRREDVLKHRRQSTLQGVKSSRDTTIEEDAANFRLIMSGQEFSTNEP